MNYLRPVAESSAESSAEPRADPRYAELRRMRTLATALLVAMAVIFVATSFYQARLPWLGYLRAFAEASMVGACADWFAVVALFRHPLGLPIPHTAIVPRNKARIADAIGGFIAKNFLEPAVIAHRLASVDVVSWWARLLAKPGAAARLAQRTVGFFAPFAGLSDRPEVHGYLRDTTRRWLLSLPAAPLAGRVLAMLLEGGQLIELAERTIEFGGAALARNDDYLRAKVAESSSWWIPRWVDSRMADRVITGAKESLAELRAPDHPWRERFGEYAKTLIERLENDPEMRAHGERLQAKLFESPTVAEWLDTIWQKVEARLKEDLNRDAGFLQEQLEKALASSARLMAEDEPLRETVNGWIRHTIEVMVVPHRAEIGAFISEVVKRWDDTTLVGKMELTFGKDLQYIRINGTLVGGTVGLIIYALSVVSGSLPH